MHFATMTIFFAEWQYKYQFNTCKMTKSEVATLFGWRAEKVTLKTWWTKKLGRQKGYPRYSQSNLKYTIISNIIASNQTYANTS